jgi:hypothetical protein
MVPKDFHPNDYTTYDIDARSPRDARHLPDSFDSFTRKEPRPKMLSLSLHPSFGRPYRAKILQDFIRYAKSHPKVWFARNIDIVRWWQEKRYP